MDNVELKAGHAPATKVGGRRVANKKEHRTSEHHERSSSESSDEVVKEVVADADLPAKMDKSYPTAAVQKAHEKPVPTIQPHPASYQTKQNGAGHVFQPRKQTH